MIWQRVISAMDKDKTEKERWGDSVQLEKIPNYMFSDPKDSRIFNRLHSNVLSVAVNLLCCELKMST